MNSFTRRQPGARIAIGLLALGCSGKTQSSASNQSSANNPVASAPVLPVAAVSTASPTQQTVSPPTLPPPPVPAPIVATAAPEASPSPVPTQAMSPEEPILPPLPPPEYDFPDLDTDNDPDENFDLRHWYLTIPELNPETGSALSIRRVQLLSGYTDDWFFTDPETGGLVFKAPNKASTTPGTANARSELRGLVSTDESLDVKDPANNWVLESHPNADDYGAQGGRMNATLAVDFVSKSGNDESFAAHAVVIGQIHGAGKTEPLKILYRKLPNHERGSIFWSYEVRPLEEAERYDVLTDVWGDHTLTEDDAEPIDGVPLEYPISYEVDVQGDVMHLEFIKWDGSSVSFERKLSGGHEDHPIDRGYDDDWFFFKAGSYNQCNTGTEGLWAGGCSNEGLDAGDFAQVRFFELELRYYN